MTAICNPQGMFLYDTEENARQFKEKGMFGWLFWMDESIQMLKSPMVEKILVEKTAGDLLECDVETLETACLQVLKK